MKNILGYSIIWVLTILLAGLTLLVACGGDDDDDMPTKAATPTEAPTEGATSGSADDVVFTIGHISDMTGPGAAAHEYIRMATNDMVQYYNEQNLIPGVELEVIEYDEANDPSKDIAGYELLKERGANVILSGVQSPPVLLKDRVIEDGILLFAAATELEAIDPPGYVFSLGTIPQYDAYTLMKWIADNDWDYMSNGPAKIGGAGWDNSYTTPFLAAMEEYAETYPDQFEWEGDYITPMGTFTWGPEVEALKNCDYVYPGLIMTSFVREYRNAGHDGMIIGADAQLAFYSMFSDANLWDKIDGMLILKSSAWWGETDDPMVELATQLLQEYHSGDSTDIMGAGTGYLAVNQIYQIMSIIQDAANTVGAENLDSQALYDAAISFSLSTDGFQRYTFSETKRDSVDAYAVYTARAEDENIFRLHDGWIPTVREP